MLLNNFTVTVDLLCTSGKETTLTDEDMDKYREAWTNSGGLFGMINWYRAVVRYQLPQPIDIRVHVPTLVLWGKRDVALSHEMAEKSINLCNNGRLVFFDTATHWVQHVAWDDVNNQLIASFG